MKLCSPIALCFATVLAFAVSTGCLAEGNPPADFEGQGETSPNSFAWIIGNAGAQWPGGVVNWYYNPAGQPAGLSTAQMVAAIQRAMGRWSDVCNISFAYQGESPATANFDAPSSSIDRIPVITWGVLTGARAGFAGFTYYWYAFDGSMIDADIVINTAVGFTANSLFEIEALMVHEVGHMLGIAHSNVQHSVMFAAPYNTYKFQRTLRGDDVSACTQTYGASPRASENRLFNWAEVVYEQLFSPVGGVSGEAGGYLYRYYPNTGNYVGTLGGNVYILLNGGGVTLVGSTASFLPLAINAGF